MENENRLICFLKKHRILLIGFVLYVIAYNLNNIFPPFLDYNHYNNMPDWAKESTKEYASGGFLSVYMPRIIEGNRFLKVFPLDFLYFGVADMAAVVHNSIYFPAALITYVIFVFQKGLDKVCAMTPDMKKSEKIVISHLFNNVVFYPLSFVLVWLQEISSDESYTLFTLLDGMNQNILLKLLASAIVIIVLLGMVIFCVLPMLINVLYFFGYLIVFDLFADMINYIDQMVLAKALESIPLLGEFLSFLVAIVIIGIGNLLLEKILEICQNISILPARKIGSFIKCKITRNDES